MTSPTARIVAVTFASFACLAGGALVGCDDRTETEKSVDRAGERMENAAERAGENAEKAAERAGENLEKAAEKAKDNAD